jgi:hypothetical protein
MVSQTPYRILDTFSLLAAIETMSWDRADVAANPDLYEYPDNTGQHLDLHLSDAYTERVRRERLRNRSFAPQTPERSLDLAELKGRVDLVTFIEKYTPVPLVKRGKQLVGCCPLPGHDDGSPSFVVNPEKQVFYCHGCLRGGDIYSFTLAYFNSQTFADAVGLVAHEAGVPRPTRSRPTRTPNTSNYGGFGRLRGKGA